jgi:hypothetical protein
MGEAAMDGWRTWAAVRSEDMSSDRNELHALDGSSANQRAKRLVIVILIALAIFLETASWLMDRSGALSVLSAASSLHARPPAVDVDKNGLRLPVLLLLWLFVALGCRLTNVRLGLPNRPGAVLLVLALIGGGLAFEQLWGEQIITNYMAGHGYTRCVAGDHEKANSKSHVWFVNYTLTGQACHKTPSP